MLRHPRSRRALRALPGLPGLPGIRVLVVLLAVLPLTACAIPRWPVEGPVSSGWGVRWQGWLPEVHRGVDIALPIGTPVRAMAPGRVRFAGTMDGLGQVVWIDHGGAVLSVYAHLSRLDVEPGQPVGGGEVIALSGASGRVSGPHLHFEVWRWGRPQDPVRLLGGIPEGQR